MLTVNNLSVCSSTSLLLLYFPPQKKAVGSALIEQVFYHLDIIEKDYFGLQYTDHYNVTVSDKKCFS